VVPLHGDHAVSPPGGLGRRGDDVGAVVFHDAKMGKKT
jgi:hypothetical protein